METVNTSYRPNLMVFSETLQELAKGDQDILVVTSDSRGSGKLMPFAEKFPDQIVEVGIAEQNLVGLAAGLASMGKKAFAVSPACFLTARSLEQIKNDVAYSDNPVKLIGISAGVSYGALGSTHHSLHDFAVLRAIHNLTIVAPCDNFETRAAIQQAAEMSSPVYLRFGKKGLPTMNQDFSPDFKIGKGRIIREGQDLTFIATGEGVWPCEEAAACLSEEHNIKARVISMHTIKPLDTGLILEVAAAGKPIITVEEHSVHGGLGEAVAATLLQNDCRNRFRIMAIPDEYTVTGSQSDIFQHYGISKEGIAQKALEIL